MRLAIERFAATVTVPLLFERPDSCEVDQVGTGTLFDHEGKLLLVTAQHLFDDFRAELLVIPSTGTTELHGIGSYGLFRARPNDIDVAVLHLRHQPTIARVRASWRVLRLANSGTASRQGLFVLTGYPSERVTRKGGLLGGSLLSVYTERLEEVPAGAKEPVHGDLDLFFSYEKELLDLQNQSVTAPHLGGCSGASVWEYREPPGNEFWLPERCLAIVGVQSDFFQKGEYFRAKSWAYVADMIRRLSAGEESR